MATMTEAESILQVARQWVVARDPRLQRQTARHAGPELQTFAKGWTRFEDHLFASNLLVGRKYGKTEVLFCGAKVVDKTDSPSKSEVQWPC